MDSKKLTADELNTLLPYAFSGELDYLRDVGHALTPGALVVMLGVGPGIMALALLEGAQDEIALYGVDTGNFTATLHLEAAGNAEKLIPIVERSWDAAEPFTNNTVDLLIVDACHEYKCVRRDINAWLPKVRSGGVIFFHDYVVQKRDAPNNGVRKAVERAREKLGEEMTRVGCSIVFRKA